MITYIKINGFKSFHNFEMVFTPFTVVAGLNAAGKSNLFDALKLLTRMAETDNLKKAFKEQRGEFTELFTQYHDHDYATEMEFCIEMLVNKDVKDVWGNEATLKYTRLRYEIKIKRLINSSGIEDLIVTYEHLENLKHGKDQWVKIIPGNYLEEWRPKVRTGKRGIPYIQTIEENGIPTVLVPQDGTTGNKRRFPLKNATRTVLSTFDTIDFPHVFAAKEEMRSWKYLQLNPEDLRQPTSKSTGTDTISQSGKNLAAALYRIKQEDNYTLKEITRKLQNFLPHFTQLEVIDDKENKQYLIKLRDKDSKEYTSRVLSEGTLRILALCIMDFDDRHTGLLCFEEPENGIHPFRINDMADLLKDLSTDFSDEMLPLRQVIVNTHSPVLLGRINSWKDNHFVSIWFAQMKQRITNIKGGRIDLPVTGILPVVRENLQLLLDFTEQETKLGLTAVRNYLNTANNI